MQAAMHAAGRRVQEGRDARGHAALSSATDAAGRTPPRCRMPGRCRRSTPVVARRLWHLRWGRDARRHTAAVDICRGPHAARGDRRGNTHDAMLLPMTGR